LYFAILPHLLHQNSWDSLAVDDEPQLTSYEGKNSTVPRGGASKRKSIAAHTSRQQLGIDFVLYLRQQIRKFVHQFHQATRVLR
jgi:hypothetical protein